MRIKRDVMATMRDGVRLAADICLPDEGPDAPQRWPTLLMRTGYDKSAPFLAPTQGLADEGYAVVVQDLRGLHASEGEHDFAVTEAADGVDTIAWIRAQPWSDGQVGMVGASYLGLTQWHAATASPDGLVAIYPTIAGSVFDGFGFHSRGVVQLDMLIAWTAGVLVPHHARRAGGSIGDPGIAAVVEAHKAYTAAALAGDMPGLTAAMAARAAAVAALFTRPLTELVDAVATTVPWVREWTKHLDPADDFWAERDYSRAIAGVTTAVFQVGGWHDLFIRGTIRDFVAVHAAGRAPMQKLVVHPFGHAGPGQVGSVSFDAPPLPDPCAFVGMSPAPGPNLGKRWLDRHLRNIDTGIEREPPVSLYVIGAGWRDEWEWPLARTQWTRWYLHSAGQANTRGGDGWLSTTSPRAEPADHFRYDPVHPVPSCGGTFLGFGEQPGMFDQAGVEARNDVLVYSSAPLDAPMETTGPVAVELWAATSAADTDFTAKLVDVDADDVALNVCDGVTRLGFRSDSPGPIVPDAVLAVRIELSPTSYVFAAGHRLRVQISSSNYPLFDPNPNTGGSLLLDDRTIVAEQTVFHDAARPSAIILPVIP